jgi:hypothetical protein
VGQELIQRVLARGLRAVVIAPADDQQDDSADQREPDEDGPDRDAAPPPQLARPDKPGSAARRRSTWGRLG